MPVGHPGGGVSMESELGVSCSGQGGRGRCGERSPGVSGRDGAKVPGLDELSGQRGRTRRMGD